MDGARTYKVTLPPKRSARAFWSFTLYDNQTRSILTPHAIRAPGARRIRHRGESERGWFDDGLLGRPTPGVDRGNWIRRCLQGWFTILRLYSPLESFFTKAWRLPRSRGCGDPIATGVRRVAMLAAVASLAAGCGKQADTIAQAEKKDVATELPHQASPSKGDCRGRVHLRLAAGDELRGDERVRRGHQVQPVQGPFNEINNQHRVATPRPGGHHANSDTPYSICGWTARRADGDSVPAVAKPRYYGCSWLGRQYVQLRIHRQSRHRGRTPAATSSSARHGKAIACGHQEGVCVDDAVRVRRLPDAALQPAGHATKSREGEAATRRSRCPRS